jgi:hypothetical protein
MNDIFEKIQADFDEFMKSAKEFIEKEKAKHISQQEKKVRRWKPEKGDDFWFLAGTSIVKSIYSDGDIDKCIFKAGDGFKTKDEAQKELNRRIAEQELLDMCDWNGEESVYLIEYNDQRDVFEWNWYEYIYSPYRFASKESAQKAIDTLGPEKLKLIFRID